MLCVVALIRLFPFPSKQHNDVVFNRQQTNKPIEIIWQRRNGEKKDFVYFCSEIVEHLPRKHWNQTENETDIEIEKKTAHCCFYVYAERGVQQLPEGWRGAERCIGECSYM